MSNWTVCWIAGDGADQWNRFETANDVLECLEKEESNSGSDFLIIPPRQVTSLEEMDADYFRTLHKSGCFD